MKSTHIIPPGVVFERTPGAAYGQVPDSDPPVDCCDTDPEDFPDRAAAGYAEVQVPSATPALVQSKSNAGGPTVSIVLDSSPTVGNLMVLFAASRGTSITMTPSGSGWSLVEDGFCGAGAGQWNVAMYWRTVAPGDGTGWSVTRASGTDPFGFALLELEGVSTLDAAIESSNATSEPTTSITPSGDHPAILVSGVSVRHDSDQAFTPASGMTEVFDVNYGSGDNGPQVAVNYRVVTTPTGSYTVGSTYGGGSQRVVLGAAFGGGTGFAPAWNAIDGDDATY